MKSNRRIFILAIALVFVLATFINCEKKNSIKKTETTLKSSNYIIY